MNIFATSDCPYESAEYLDDKRVVKMVLETTQLLSTVMHIYGGKGPYRPTHSTHPCTLWAAESKANSQWLFRHYQALCLEYTRRYNKTHACYQYHDTFKQFFGKSIVAPKSFVNCTTYKGMRNTQLAYQLYMCDKWEADKRTPTWYGVGR